MAWMNNDGLYIKYGREEGAVGTSGVYQNVESGKHILELTVDLATLSIASQTVLDDNIRMPVGYIVERVDIFMDIPATSAGSATLDVGFIKSYRVTEYDYDGLAAAVPLASLNVQGKRTILDVGSTGAGALVGTKLAGSPGAYPVAKAGTAVFTAGRAKIRVIYRRP